MVEILFEGGKARELQESDISTLIEMCDEDVLKYFFSSGNKNMDLYWGIQIAEQCPWGGELHNSRNRYVFSIEHENKVKGCFLLEYTMP